MFLDAIMNNTKIDDEIIQQDMNNNNNKHHQSSTPPVKADDTITINGTNYRKVNILQITSRIHNKSTSNGTFSLVDRGAKGGLFGV
jgi:FlaG/FlaF family flagellin (archaellin)